MAHPPFQLRVNVWLPLPMATQPDNIDVAHLVQIGLIGTIFTIAISYLVVGLTHAEEKALQQQRSAELDQSRVLSEVGISDAARQAVIERYAK